MRWNEILVEQNSVYEDMIQAFKRLYAKHGIDLPTNFINQNPDGTWRKWTLPVGSPRQEAWPVHDLRKELRWAKEKLHRKDRIVWFMWHARMAIIHKLYRAEVEKFNQTRASAVFANSHRDDGKVEQPEKHDLLNATEAAWRDYLINYQRTFGHQYPAPYDGDWGFVPKGLLSHYASLDEIGVPEVTKIVWGRQTPEQLITQLEAAEEAWVKRSTNDRFVDNMADDKVVLSFPDGFQWVMLNREKCDQEGAAMGHCGNGADFKKGDRILSLRRKEKKGKQKGLRPHLTFILHSDGSLGEMKGRFNKKPDSSFHPHIIELLKQPFVKTVDGGGFRPDQNFELKDLPEAARKELVAFKNWSDPLS